MYAVIRSGGKQYRVEPGQTVRVERLEGKVGGKVTFDEVIAVRNDDKKILRRRQRQSQSDRQDREARSRSEAQGFEVQDGRAVQNSARPPAGLHAVEVGDIPNFGRGSQWHIKRAAGHLQTDAIRTARGSESSDSAGKS